MALHLPRYPKRFPHPSQILHTPTTSKVGGILNHPIHRESRRVQRVQRIQKMQKIRRIRRNPSPILMILSPQQAPSIPVRQFRI